MSDSNIRWVEPRQDLASNKWIGGYTFRIGNRSYANLFCFDSPEDFENKKDVMRNKIQFWTDRYNGPFRFYWNFRIQVDTLWCHLKGLYLERLEKYDERI